VLYELRLAVRSLRRRPTFLATAMMTIALGVGASATLFSVVHGVLRRPFPYQAPERLAILWQSIPSIPGPGWRARRFWSRSPCSRSWCPRSGPPESSPSRALKSD